MKVEITRFRSGSPKLLLLLNIPKDYCCPECSRFIYENPHGREFPKIFYDAGQGIVTVNCFCEYELRMYSVHEPGVVLGIAYQILELGSGVLVNFSNGSESTAMTLVPLSEK